MNRVLVSTMESPLPEWTGLLKSYARKVLALLGREKWDLSVLLCDDRIITVLNSRYRGKEQATDVLSFVQDEGENFPLGSRSVKGRRLPGDIVISLDTLRKNARRFNVSEDEELRRILIHGILHLDGMDHKSNDNTEPMLRLQEKILSELEGIRILPKAGLAGRA